VEWGGRGLRDKKKKGWSLEKSRQVRQRDPPGLWYCYYHNKKKKKKNKNKRDKKERRTNILWGRGESATKGKKGERVQLGHCRIQESQAPKTAKGPRKK